MQPTTLIQLISAETLQNLLPVLSLKPSRVISIISGGGTPFGKRCDDIENAIRLATNRFSLSSNIEFIPVVLEARSPMIAEVAEAISKIVGERLGEQIAINYTGGTKEMSIGAWSAASKHRLPSLYCDSPAEFRSGDTAPLSFPLSLHQVAEKLEIPTILAAQGFLRNEHWKVFKTSSARIAFGSTSYRLFREHTNEIRVLQNILQRHGNPSGAKRPKPADVDWASNHSIQVPSTGPTIDFMVAAARTQLLIHRREGWFFNIPRNGPMKMRVANLDKVLMQLTGGAYEGFIHHCLERSRRFGNFLHGVMPVGSSEDSLFGETDFLAFDPSNLSLNLISCKSSPPGLEHLEATIARKSQLGGRFARATLCVKSADPKRASELRKQCGLLGIEVLIGTEVEEAFSVEEP